METQILKHKPDSFFTENKETIETVKDLAIIIQVQMQ
jgi:hypothetical protein